MVNKYFYIGGQSMWEGLGLTAGSRDLIIESLKKHFPARFPEWLAAATMTAWGAYLVLYPDLFHAPPIAAVYAGMASMAHQPVWALAALAIGVTRAAALFINGVYTRTPMIRLVTAFLSAFVWTQVLIGLVRSDIPNLGLIMYASALSADIYSAYRAGIDATFAERQRRDKQAEIGGRGNSDDARILA